MVYRCASSCLLFQLARTSGEKEVDNWAVISKWKYKLAKVPYTGETNWAVVWQRKLCKERMLIDLYYNFPFFIISVFQATFFPNVSTNLNVVYKFAKIPYTGEADWAVVWKWKLWKERMFIDLYYDIPSFYNFRFSGYSFPNVSSNINVAYKFAKMPYTGG